MPEDLEAILRLCDERKPEGRPARGVSAEVRQEFRKTSYRTYAHALGQSPNLHGLLAVDGDEPVGFTILITGLTKSITGEPQGSMLDACHHSHTSLLKSLMEIGDPAGVVLWGVRAVDIDGFDLMGVRRSHDYNPCHRVTCSAPSGLRPTEPFLIQGSVSQFEADASDDVATQYLDDPRHA